MSNLHRDLAPITPAAWAEIEEEAARTFKRVVAGRRFVDLVGPGGFEQSAVGTGHLAEIAAPTDGVLLRRREVKPLVEVRVPFTVTRSAVDDVERGSKDSDWQPVKDAAQAIAQIEDHLIFSGSAEAAIEGITQGTSNQPIAIPAQIADFPDAVAQALSALRLDGVDGPYSLVLSAELYTEVSEETDHGYPVRKHIERLLPEGGEIIWAPALDGALLVTTRGGDFELHLGRDVSIGYQSHTDTEITLYLEESLTFLNLTAEASVVIGG